MRLPFMNCCFRKISFICALTMLSSVMSVSSALGETTDIEALINEAFERNPEIQAFEAALLESKGQILTAKTWENPELSVGPSVKHLPGSDGERSDSFYKGTYEITQKILFPGKRALEISLSAHDLKISEIALAGIRNQVEFKVRKAFFQLLIAQELLDLRKEQLQSAKTFAEAAKKRASSGYASDFDAIKSEAEFIAAEKLLLDAKAELGKSKIALNSLLVRPLNAPFEAIGSTKQISFIPPPLDLVDYALAYSPALKIQLLKAKRAGVNVQATEKSKYPDFTVGPFVEYGRDEQVYGVGVSLPLPFWDTKQGNIQVAVAQQKKEAAEIEKVKLEISQAVSSAFAEYSAANMQAELFTDDFHKRLETAMKQAERSYQSNATSLLIYLDAKRTFFESFADHYETLKNLSDSYFELESAVGIPLQNN